MKQKKVLVIGAGVSGMTAAILAAQNGAGVTIFEQNDRVGKKILSTGNGKCNFSNTQMDGKYYHTDAPVLLQQILKQYPTSRICEFFSNRGVLTVIHRKGLYPLSGQAATILDFFRIQLKKQGVSIEYNQKVEELKPYHSGKETGFLVKTKNKKERFDSVILSTGGMAAPATGSNGSGYKLAQALGHTVIPCLPALVQLRCQEGFLKSVAGVRQEARVELLLNEKPVQQDLGEVQFTDYGVSGIVIFQLSAIAARALAEKKKVRLLFDFLPDLTDDAYENWKKTKRENLFSRETLEEFFSGLLHKKLMSLFVRRAGLKLETLAKDIPAAGLEQVFTYCKSFSLTVTGTNSFDQAQTTSGGIPLSECTNALESKLIKGLFLTGELLNVDGICGGYNLHWAIASGDLAGSMAAHGTGE